MKHTTGRKLAGLGVLGVVGILLVGGVGYHRIGAVHGEFDRFGTTHEILRLHVEAEALHEAVASDVLGVLAAQSDADRARARTSFDRHVSELEYRVRQMQGPSLDGSTAVDAAQTSSAIEAFVRRSREIVQASGQDPEQHETLRSEMNQQANALGEHLARNRAAIEDDVDHLRSEILGSTKRSLGWLIGTTLCSALVIGGLCASFAHGIRRRLHAILDMVEASAQGDLTHSTRVEGDDDLTQMLRRLGEFVATLRAGIGEIRTQGEQVGASARDLETVSQHVADEMTQMNERARVMAEASEQIAESTSAVATSVAQSSSHVETVASAAEEMSVILGGVATRSNQMAEEITSIAAAVEQMTTSLESVAASSDQAARIAERASESADQANEMVELLGQSANEIGNVVEVISEIAEQTNLLALNATIEAASAGDAGRGFAVVANEVKDLAKQTAHATDEIARRITNMQHSTKSSVSAIRAIVDIINEINQISQSIAHSVADQRSTANEIARSIASASEAARDINQAVHHSSAGSSEVARNVEELANGASEIAQRATDGSRATEEVSLSIREVQQGIERTGGATSRVARAARDLGSLAERLTELTAHYRL